MAAAGGGGALADALDAPEAEGEELLGFRGCSGPVLRGLEVALAGCAPEERELEGFFAGGWGFGVGGGGEERRAEGLRGKGREAAAASFFRRLNFLKNGQNIPLTDLDRPSVMSTCDRMQVTHMLDGLGRMDAPQRQQRLFGWKGMREEEGDAVSVVKCPSMPFPLSLSIESSQTTRREAQQHSHMAHSPLRDERRGGSRAVKHHKEGEREEKLERASSNAAAEFFCLCAKNASKKKKKGKKEAAAALLPTSQLFVPTQRSLSCFLRVLSPW